MNNKTISIEDKMKQLEKALDIADKEGIEAANKSLSEQAKEITKRWDKSLEDFKESFAKHEELVKEHRLAEATINYQVKTGNFTSNYFMDNKYKKQLEAEIKESKQKLERMVKGWIKRY